jgi:hypothetical protein
MARLLSGLKLLVNRNAIHAAGEVEIEYDDIKTLPADLPEGTDAIDGRPNVESCKAQRGSEQLPR